MPWLGLDIGGANVKAADGNGYAISYGFPLWKQPRDLVGQLRTAISEAPSNDHLAVTMTGELADCFENKAAGVAFILEAVGQAADGRHTRVYQCDGRLVSLQVAHNQPQLAAASNWRALAQFATRYAPEGAGLLLDVGSTTCDVIPLTDGQVTAQGMTDTERLLAGELVYMGVERTPLCALVQNVPYRDQLCPVAAEWFATTRDIYLLQGNLSEDPGDTDTADGKPATKAAARARLARTICADSENFHHRDAAVMAKSISVTQQEKLAAAIRQVSESPQTIVLSGHGEFLARRTLEELDDAVTVVSLTRELGAVVSRCAPAHALAVLANEAGDL